MIKNKKYKTENILSINFISAREINLPQFNFSGKNLGPARTFSLGSLGINELQHKTADVQ
jgi:hypothetical protein